MNALTQINTALKSRSMAPLSCTCAACGEAGFEREEMASDGVFRASLLDALKLHHGGAVCVDCAGSACQCVDCGGISEHTYHCAECGEEVCGDCAQDTASGLGVTCQECAQ